MLVTLDSASGEPDFTFVEEYSQREDEERDAVMLAFSDYAAPGVLFINDFVNSPISLYIDGTWHITRAQLLGIDRSSWPTLEWMDNSWDRLDNVQGERFVRKSMCRGPSEVQFSIWEDLHWDIRDANKELPLQQEEIFLMLKESYEAYFDASGRFARSTRRED